MTPVQESGPYLVSRIVRNREWCDADTASGRCKHDATIVSVSGVLSGEHYCTFHANKLSIPRHDCEDVSRTRVASVEAVASFADVPAAVKRAVAGRQGMVRARVHAELTTIDEYGGSLKLPDGSTITVEQTTWRELAHLSGDPELLRQALALGDRIGSRTHPRLTAAILAAFNALRKS